MFIIPYRTTKVLKKMNFSTSLPNISDPQTQEAILAAIPQLTEQEREQLINQILQEGNRKSKQSIRLDFLAAACLDLIDTPTSSIVQAVSAQLNRWLPPTNSRNADTLAEQAGTLAIKPLIDWLSANGTQQEKQRSFCLRTLLHIPGLLSLQALHTYLQNTNTPFTIEDALRYWKMARDPDGYGQYILALVFEQRGVTHLRLLKPSDMRGLQYLTMLESLYLDHYGGLHDLTPLAGLSSLKYLYMPKCKRVVDLSPLATLSNLEVLDITKCSAIQSLAPLRNLRKLREIHMQECTQINDISGLVNKPNLVELTLHTLKNLESIPTVVGLTGLKRLTIRYLHKLKDIRGLGDLAQLDLLEIDECSKLKDLQPLANLPRLQEIRIRHCSRITNLRPLTSIATLTTFRIQTINVKGMVQWSQLQQLRSLEVIAEDYFTDLQEFGCIPHLEELRFHNNQTSDFSTNPQHYNRWTTNNVNIESFSGIEQATHLKSFIYKAGNDNTTPMDFSPLCALPNLTKLELSNIHVQNLDVLADLQQLEILRLENFHQLASLQGLSNLPALRQLSFSQCSVPDLNPIRTCPNLKTLEFELTDNPLDLAPLHALPALQELMVSFYVQGSFLNIESLQGQPTLRKLDLRGTQLPNTSVLATLPALEQLDMHIHEIALHTFASLPTLTSLCIDGDTVTDLIFLKNFPLLQSLTIHQQSNLLSLQGIEHLQQLQHLDCNGVHSLQDVSALAMLTNLRTLSLSGARNVRDISPLSGLTQLEALNLNHCEVEDLTPLRSLTHLRQLYLFGCRDKDLSPLAGLIELEKIEYFTPSEDLTPLLHLPKLRHVSLVRLALLYADVHTGLMQLFARPEIHFILGYEHHLCRYDDFSKEIARWL
ncbi:hypothetical protein KSF_001790 [Reticulibacter mediterranei]|uniref:Disease resistance protein At4g27190-like leucine-rich repeats domain-containing protein n=2 Tax=Reticulibacter mediterranei TaxID=2778369 RepID=A0A8J3I908_9CHLR|nr:hypothetical protein KSF_001790 [Reticulibacter mediterranei]